MIRATSFLLPALFFVACISPSSNTPSKPPPTQPTWPDTQEVVGAVKCAIHKLYGPQVAAKVMAHKIQTSRNIVVEGQPVAGWYQGGVVMLDSSAASMKASAYRHEVFLHRLPEVLTGDVNADHDAKWEPTRVKLNREFRKCLTPLKG